MTSQITLPTPGRRWLIIITVMAVTIMQVLDTTIANVALPHMQASLGATPESIVWVLTSYIIMAAIATPVTGWLETRFGRRNIFAVSIAGFTVSSVLCGISTSLEMMVASRALQGVFGAFIGPLGLATLLDSSSKEKHPQTMLIWGMGILIGPIMGPVLGGWLTDNYGWRWVFFINLPIGIVATIGVWSLLDRIELPRRLFDGVGFALLALTLAGFQLMLDRGSQLGWFQSSEILIEAGIAVGAFWMFVVHSFTSPAPLLPLALFRDRNFVLATIFTMLVTGVMMAGAALVAPMLQILMGYDAMGAGMMMVPRGLGALIAMPVATYLSTKIDPRLLIGFGIVITASSLWLMTGFDLEMDGRPVMLAGFIQGLGMGFSFLPLNILAFSTLAENLRTEAASLYSLVRNLGGSIAISAMGALLSRNVQVSHSDLAIHMTSTGIPVIESGILERFGVQGATVARMIDAEINRQALMIAYLDDFVVMQWAAIITLPLILFMRRTKVVKGAPAIHVE